jgi:hypothetical protein
MHFFLFSFIYIFYSFSYDDHSQYQQYGISIGRLMTAGPAPCKKAPAKTKNTSKTHIGKQV